MISSTEIIFVISIVSNILVVFGVYVKIIERIVRVETLIKIHLEMREKYERS